MIENGTIVTVTVANDKPNGSILSNITKGDYLWVKGMVVGYEEKWDSYTIRITEIIAMDYKPSTKLVYVIGKVSQFHSSWINNKKLQLFIRRNFLGEKGFVFR
jgi:hypothetical protein